MSPITIPATYHSSQGVVIPKRKISQNQIDNYTIVVSLIPKKDRATQDVEEFGPYMSAQELIADLHHHVEHATS